MNITFLEIASSLSSTEVAVAWIPLARKPGFYPSASVASSCGIHVSASAFWSPFRAQLDAAMPNLDSVNFPGLLNYLGVTILIYFNVSRAINYTTIQFLWLGFQASK